MYPIIAGEIAAQRIAVLHQQAARQRPVRQVRAAGAASLVNGQVRVGWVRLSLQRTRLLAA
jgi:hypothetical protein